MLKDEEIEKWITVKGNHIPISKGQSKKEAIERFVKQKQSNYKVKEIEDDKKIIDDYNKHKEFRDKNYQYGIMVEKHYKKLRNMGLKDNEILYLESKNIYTYDENYNRAYKTIDEYKKDIENKKNELKEWKKWWEEREKNNRELILKKEKDKREEMKQEGITSEQYDKEYRASRYREERIAKAIYNYNNLQGKTSGYSENGKSVRAIIAEYNGKYSKSEASKMLGVSEKMIEKYCYKTEWHHSGGKMYNEVDYYDISKYIDIADNGYRYFIDDDDYTQEVENWIKMTHRKKV